MYLITDSISNQHFMHPYMIYQKRHWGLRKFNKLCWSNR